LNDEPNLHLEEGAVIVILAQKMEILAHFKKRWGFVPHRPGGKEFFYKSKNNKGY